MLILIPPNLVLIPPSLPCWKISSHNSHENFIIIEIQEIFMFPRSISQSLKIRAHSTFQVSYLQIPSQQVRHVYRVCWKEYFYLQYFFGWEKNQQILFCVVPSQLLIIITAVVLGRKTWDEENHEWVKLLFCVLWKRNKQARQKRRNKTQKLLSFYWVKCKAKQKRRWTKRENKRKVFHQNKVRKVSSVVNLDTWGNIELVEIKY